jgi:hypothetical protein
MKALGDLSLTNVSVHIDEGAPGSTDMSHGAQSEPRRSRHLQRTLTCQVDGSIRRPILMLKRSCWPTLMS